MPRRQRPIDAGQVYELSRIGATIKEMAAVMRVPLATLEARIYAKKDNEIKESYERGKSDLKVSVRRTLLDLAANGNASAAIWLSKQLLGWSERNAEKVAAEEASNEQPAAEQALVFAAPSGADYQEKLQSHLAHEGASHPSLDAAPCPGPDTVSASEAESANK